MSAATLLEDLRRRGITVAVESGTQLRLRGSGAALSNELLDQVKAHKAALIALVETPEPPSEWEGTDYPPLGVDLGKPSHLLADIPVVCRAHVSNDYDDGYRWELLRCRQPDGDGLLGWVVITDDCYLPIVRERGVIKTLNAAATFNSPHLRETRR